MFTVPQELAEHRQLSWLTFACSNVWSNGKTLPTSPPS